MPEWPNAVGLWVVSSCVCGTGFCRLDIRWNGDSWLIMPCVCLVWEFGTSCGLVGCSGLMLVLLVVGYVCCVCLLRILLCYPTLLFDCSLGLFSLFLGDIYVNPRLFALILRVCAVFLSLRSIWLLFYLRTRVYSCD